MVSRVGTDSLGDEAVSKIKSTGLSVTGIQKDTELPTGRVIVSFDSDGEPSYDIAIPAAWDNIEVDKITGKEPYYLIYGTLAQRNEKSRAAIRELWDDASVRFYDVNLRPPFTPQKTVIESLKAADIVKLNSEEFEEICGWLQIKCSDKQDAARSILEQCCLSCIVVTQGEAGAWCITKDEYCRHEGYKVKTVDTVGAGDAFFAKLISEYISDTPWQDILKMANKHGAYVASRKGALG